MKSERHSQLNGIFSQTFRRSQFMYRNHCSIVMQHYDFENIDFCIFALHNYLWTIVLNKKNPNFVFQSSPWNDCRCQYRSAVSKLCSGRWMYKCKRMNENSILKFKSTTVHFRFNFQLCGVKLTSCSHQCAKVCHKDDPQHQKYNCQKPCEKSCPKGHSCKAKCFKSCPPCPVLVTKTLPCRHTPTLMCHVREESVTCYQLVEKTLLCTHKETMACFVDYTKYVCKVKLLKELKCGIHRKEMECNKDPKDVTCKVVVEKTLPCKHKQVSVLLVLIPHRWSVSFAYIVSFAGNLLHCTYIPSEESEICT